MMGVCWLRLRSVLSAARVGSEWGRGNRVLPFSGQRDRLVPAAQGLGAANELQGEGGPRQPEESSGQPSHDLHAADAQQGGSDGLHTQNRVRSLHPPGQVT